MKTVSGVVVSSKPVSLSKAAKILSKFALADNGASPAIHFYLKRASDAFDEIVELQKELRGSGSQRKSEKHRSGISDEADEAVNSIRNYGEDEQAKENGVAAGKKDLREKKSGADGRGDEVKVPKKKKKNAKDESEGKDNSLEQTTTQGQGTSDTTDSSVESKKRKKDAKKVKKDANEDGRSNGVVGILKQPIHIVNGVSNGENKTADLSDAQNEKKGRKKRKIEEMDTANGEVNDSAEKRMQSKKRKKSKSEVGN